MHRLGKRIEIMKAAPMGNGRLVDLFYDKDKKVAITADIFVDSKPVKTIRDGNVVVTQSAVTIQRVQFSVGVEKLKRHDLDDIIAVEAKKWRTKQHKKRRIK